MPSHDQVKPNKRKGVTLIGVTEAGKSTVGPILANKLDWTLYDIDSLILKREKASLIGQVLKSKGQEYLLDLEAKTALSLELCGAVLVTPGSIIYGVECHEHLRSETTIVYLDVNLPVILERLGKYPHKADAVIGLKDNLESLFNERKPLYESLADLRIKCADKTPGDIAQEILENLV